MSRKIMVVDDEPDLVSLVQVMLAAHGYEVVVAHNGVDALQKAEKEKPDLILLDVTMPRMHGLDVLSNLRDKPETASTPVIMLTATEDEQSISRAKDLGSTDYILKPFNSEALIDSIKKYLA